MYLEGVGAEKQGQKLLKFYVSVKQFRCSFSKGAKQEMNGFVFKNSLIIRLRMKPSFCWDVNPEWNKGKVSSTETSYEM